MLKGKLQSIVFDRVTISLPGGETLLSDLTFELKEGEAVLFRGLSGVGKTTLILAIMGHARVSHGSIRWRGRDLTRLAPHWRARDGLGWVAQEREIFPSLSVEENLTVAARSGRWDLAAVFDLFPRLAERRASRPRSISTSVRRRNPG